MEEDEEKINIYFIYGQKGEFSKIEYFELNEQVINAEILTKEAYGNYIAVLYCIEVIKSKIGNLISISLIDDKGELYISNISTNSLKYAGNGKIFFIYKLQFRPFEYNENNNLEQIILDYQEQFYIFRQQFKKDINILTNLYKSTFYNFLMRMEPTFNFILSFFFDIFDVDKYSTYPELKIVFKYFFQNMKIILGNSIFVDSLDISKSKLNILSDSENIKVKLLSIFNHNDKEENMEENIILFLAYYYIHYEHKLFIKFINNKNEEEKYKIKNILKSNRKIFNDFSTKVINSPLMMEAEDGYELLSLVELYPNIIEFFKILTLEEIYNKFLEFQRNEQKAINVMYVLKPNKNDNMDLLCDYFKIIFKKDFFPVIIREDFFVEYHKLFEKEDFPKATKLMEIINLCMVNLRKMNSIDFSMITQQYFQKGLELIKNKKLLNENLIDFLNICSRLKLIKDSSIIIELVFNYIPKCIILEEKKSIFLNKILNNDDFGEFNLKNYLKDYYYIVFEQVFEQFKTPKDLLQLLPWNINIYTPEEIIEIFLLTIKRIWLKYPENNMHGLDNLFAKEFAFSSLKVKNYMEIFEELEKKIEKKKLMVMYSQVLLKENSSFKFEEHITNFIRNNNDQFTPRYIWFLTSTEKETDNKIETLKIYIENEGQTLAVKYTDFIEYPNIAEERIILFTKIKLYKLMNQFRKTTYYKYSMNSKNYLNCIIYKDAVRMINNMNEIQKLLESYFIEKGEEDDFILIYLTNFIDEIDSAKIHYETLRDIQSFWKSFFPNEKKNNLKEIEESINLFEASEIRNCKDVIELQKEFLKYKNEAEEGKKLQQSIFFMEFYNICKTKEKNESKIYELSKEKFNELKIWLENRGNLNLLSNDTKDIIVNAAYKNQNLLNEEMIFLCNYFKFGKNEGNNNYSMKIAKNEINNLVQNMQNLKGYYKFDINDKFKFEDEEIQEEKNNKEKDTIITNEDDDFSLFNLKKEENTCQKSENLDRSPYIEEKLKIIEDISSQYNSIYYMSKKIENNKNDQDLENFYRIFTQFYSTIFKINTGFAKLSVKEIYNDVIQISDKIFLIGKNIGIFDNIVKDAYKEELILISVFNFLIHILKTYVTIYFKKKFLSIIRMFHNLNDDKNDNVNIPEINNILEFLKKHIPQDSQNSLKNSMIEIYEKEIRKNMELREIIKLILNKKNNFLYNDLIPILDLAFNNEINEKFEFDKALKIDDFSYLDFVSSVFNIINELCSRNGDFRELILYYFESKIMARLNETIRNNKNIFIDDNANYEANNIKEYFIKCLNFLDNVDKKNINKYLSLLYAISFVKCFINKLIQLSYEDPKLLEGNNLIKKIKGPNANDKKNFRYTLKFYIMKLIYQKCGNCFDFFNKDFSYLIDIDDIKNKEYNEKYKDSQFDFILLPIQQNNKENDFKNLFMKLRDMKTNKESEDEDISKIINKCQIDELFCVFANLHFSFFIENNYFDSSDYTRMSQWIDSQLKKEAINLLKNNELFKKIFEFFIELKNQNQNFLTYDKLLSLIFSARLVLNSLSIITDSKGLFYNIIKNPKDAINKNMNFFKYYLKTIDINSPEIGNINILTYKIINFYILSHLYFGYILKQIDIEDIQLVVDFENIDITKEKNIENYLFEKAFNEFIFIKTKLIPLLGINNIIIFMDSIFKSLYKIMNDYICDNKEENIKEKEKIINIEINTCIEFYKKNINDYYTYIKDFNVSNRLIDILFENPELYNNNVLINDEFPFLNYLTYTNYPDFDDFKNQFIFFNNDVMSYPFIKSILYEDNIFKIVKFITSLNTFSNYIFDKLSMKISRADINKTIKEVFHNDNNIKEYIKEYNNFVLNVMKDKKYEIISDENKLGDILNINGSKINLLYKDIIDIYNSKLKVYQENRDLIEDIVIQEGRENDYDFSYVMIDENKVTIKDKLIEMIRLYSIRIRKEKENNKLNVYDGGKIMYKFDMIEIKLKEMFTLGKKFFSENQKIFIFSEDINEDIMDNVFEELNKDFEQKISDEHKNKINTYLNSIKNDESILLIYYNLFMIFKFWIQNKKIFNIYNDEKNFDYIIRYMELRSYNLEHIKEAQKLCNYILNFNNIFIFFESVKLRLFLYLTNNIKQNINKEELNIDKKIQNEIEEILDNNKLITKDILIKSVKKYILRYLKNNENKNFLFKFEDLFNKKNIFDKNISNNEKFKEEFDKLNKKNSDDNCLVKYCLCCIYDIQMNNMNNDLIQDRNNEEDNFDDL